MASAPGDRRRVLPRHLRKPVSAPETFSYSIRPVREEDLPAIREIYNYYVTNSAVTFDEKRPDMRYWRDKLARLQKLQLPFLVAVSASDEVIGYTLAQPWNNKSGFRYTVEESIYLGPSAGGKGLGTVLLQALLDACQERGLREVVAVVSDAGAEASLALHRRLGFVEVGRMGRVGRKFGRDLGTIYLQRSLRRPRERSWGFLSRRR